MTTTLQLKDLPALVESLQAQLDDVRAVLNGYAPNNPDLRTLRIIQQLVAAYYNVSVVGLQSPARPERLAWPRQVAMCLIREFTKFSLDQIGQEFGGRDHGTVVHGVRVVGARCETNAAEARSVEMLRGQVRTALSTINFQPSTTR